MQNCPSRLHSPPGCLSRLPNKFCVIFAPTVELPIAPAFAAGLPSRLPLYRCRRSLCQSQPTPAATQTQFVEQELRELQANGEHGETELPDETEFPDGTELPDENGQRGETCLQSVWASVIFQAI